MAITSPPDLSQKLPRLVPRRRKQQPSEQSDPAPETPPLPSPPDSSTVEFTIPTRRIISKKDHDLFLSSPTYSLLLSFIFSVSDSIRDTPISRVAKETQTSTVQTILSVLEEAEALVAVNPPLETGSRFGNPAFREYLSGITSHLQAWHTRLSLPKESIQEISTYLANAFGSGTRIDYGSGHELNFMLWLLCLNRMDLLPESTFPSLALIIFPRYLRLMRTVQATYYLEPAGSHGVWGLDDYQFLPFLFGSAQLVHHPFITPKSIHSQPTLDDYSSEFLYINQVAFVNSVKNVEGLRWHSPMLDDISSAKNWGKIENGMRKMFVKEVLGKLPVMQHFLFGGLVPAVEGMSVESEGTSDAHAHHDHGKIEEGEASWGDCCGIPVPGAIGAAEEMKKRVGGQPLRRLPFD